jgi:RNA polymerase sigma-70 factor (ECF subfamily)
MAEVAWLQPYPDLALDQAGGGEPESAAVERETIELLFLAALQLLPARQRAALIARDVLGWSANETASLLGTSVAAANSALQRARTTMQQHLPERREEWTMEAANEEEMEVLARFIDAHQRCDAAAALAIAAEDIRVAMPPLPYRVEGLAELLPLLERAFGEDREGDWVLRPTRANRMPAAVSYLRRPGDSLFRAFKLDVLRIDAGRIREITTFGTALLPAFGLPPTI